MTRDQFMAYARSLAENPDRVPETLLELNTGVDTLYSQLEAMQNENETYKARVAELRDTNQKLFLKVANPVEEVKEETPEKSFDDEMAELILGGTTNGD